LSLLESRRTLALISMSVTPAVSSIQIGARLTSATPRTSLGQSSALTLPLLSACAGMRVTCEMSLWTSCSLLISKEKIATGIPFWPAACQIEFNAKAVFPIAGRAASMTRSLLWKPVVRRSRSSKPVSTPVTSPSAS
jgi:hypothetical protein